MKNVFMAMVCMFVLFTLASWGCNEETDGDADGDADGDGDWVCDPEFLGDGECDCGCGAPDTDCDGFGCAWPGCFELSCLYCYDENGENVECDPGGPDGCLVPPGLYRGVLSPGEGDCSEEAMNAIINTETALRINEETTCGPVAVGEYEHGMPIDCTVTMFGCGGDGTSSGIENGWCSIGLNHCDWACSSDLVVSWSRD